MADRDDGSTAFTRGFIDQRAATFHEAFGVKSYFNTALSKYQSKEIFDLEEALQRYQRQAPDQVDFDFDLLKCTWDDVLHELKKAQTAVSDSDTRGKKIHRRAWRALGTMEAILTPGLGALPDNLCVLHGGLAVIFSLARHRSQNRQKILQAFEDIPNVIMMAYGKAESIPRDRPESSRLHGMIGGLQETLLRILPILIDKLNPGTFMDKALSPFKDFDIDDLLGIVRNSSERVRGCAEEIMDNIIVNSHEMSKDIHTITHQTEEDVGELRGKIDEILKHQKSLQTTLDAVSSKNSLLSFVMEILKKPEQSDDEKTPKSPPPAYEGGTPVTPRQLLDRMRVNHLGALDDEQIIIRRGHSLNSEAISHAASMIQTAQVKQLLHLPESGIVLVNGCGDKSQTTKISPITNVCATLTHALRRSTSANVVLAFFCGQHSTSNDDLMGPQGLMRSLVAFLVLSLVQNKSISESAPIWFSAVQGDFEELSFKDICQLFYHLVELVPKEIPIYCVLDGISYYERPVFKGDYDVMMECFGSIIANKAMPTAFKLLLTSPTISRGLPNLMPHQIVSLRNARARGARSTESYLKSGFGNLGSQED